ncbi:Increased DNA methylation 3 [Heracleum sosnowskyi]|uniref:Increased DNA methylation 3 n=1 Tax=Heracleum sosnowskyi TaxID=360622 RepID=A0AAD8INF1_9APIA|nr:Increased DNA methylation 3 [Heracleum sosnowskyi]
MTTDQGTKIPLSKPFVTKTGTANKGTVAPSLGKVDIGASEKAYTFQVALAGVSGKQSDLKCSVRDDGRVKIEGMVTGTSLQDANVLYEVKMQEFPPPGCFSISFNLPGPVDPSSLTKIRNCDVDSHCCRDYDKDANVLFFD